MKELSERARVILERYKTAQPDLEHAPLREIVLERARRGDAPKFDVNTTPPTAPAPHFLSRFWSSAFGKLSVIAALLGTSAAGSYWHTRSVARESRAHATASTSAVPSPSALAADTAAEPLTAAPNAPSAALIAATAPSQKTAKISGANKSINQPTIDEEVRLLDAAQAALRASKPTRALELLADHRARFPNGALASTRNILHMMALAQAGRTDQACAEAQRFLASDPKSPFADRVKAICPNLGKQE